MKRRSFLRSMLALVVAPKAIEELVERHQKKKAFIRFMQSDARDNLMREVDRMYYGGARGSGKTDAFIATMHAPMRITAIDRKTGTMVMDIADDWFTREGDYQFLSD